MENIIEENHNEIMKYGTEYKENHDKIISELEKEGFIYNESFYEEIKNIILNKENEISLSFNNLNEEQKESTEYESFRRSYLNENKQYLNAVGHHMGGIQKAQKIKKFIYENDKQKEKMKRYKQIKGLKYNNLKSKINFIQLSVIFLSICLTFIESLQNILEIEHIIFSIIPIVISAYISFIIAVSRFFKYEDNKETLVKLDEKQSFIINRLAYREVILKRLLPITRFSDQKKIDNLMEIDFEKDGLDSVISQTYQDYDINMSYTDKLIYKEEWLEMKEKDIQQRIKSSELKEEQKKINISDAENNV